MSTASRLLVVSPALAALALPLADARAATDQSASNHDSAPPAEQLQGVTVTAERAKLAKRVTAFVSKITGPLFEGGLTRWGKPVCPLVSGVPRELGSGLLEALLHVRVVQQEPAVAYRARHGECDLALGTPA